MSIKKVGNIKIVFSKNEETTGELAAQACEKVLNIATEDWGLKSPQDCRIYVMTSWPEFIFNSTPLRWKLTLLLTLLLWVPRIRKTWPYSTAWTQRYGNRIAIGIKPSHLIEKSDRKIGSIMSEEEPDADKHIQNLACHEIIHACSTYLILPMWLNEGIAMLSTDRFSGKPVIRKETLQIVKDHLPKEEPMTYGNIAKMTTEDITYHDSRGYWIVKYLEENHPGFLKDILSIHRYEDEIEERMAEALGIDPNDLWQNIDDIITGYFLGNGDKKTD